MKKALLTLNHQPSGGKTWVARVTGRDEKFTFSREFLHIFAATRSGSGKTGTNSYELVQGEVYEAQEAWHGRAFYIVDADGDICKVSAAHVSRHLSSLTETSESLANCDIAVATPSAKPTTRKDIMSRAWAIARAAAAQFGGTSRAYYAESLRMAWAESR